MQDRIAYSRNFALCDIMNSSLWWNDIPGWATLFWVDLKKIIPPAQNWQVWTHWYEIIRDGRSRDKDYELVFARVPIAEWEKGPEIANAWIAGELKKLEKPATALALNPSWDFFISYSERDDAAAQEIDETLINAGFSTFAQFKDILPGNNFVAEMQRGLADSGRVVSLYSKAYWNSDHCKAEWDTSYAADPQGVNRKLVPFLLEPISLPPLARNVVYKNLVGLAGEARRKAILEAVSKIERKRSREELEQELATFASPQARISETNQLDAGPNVIFDKPFFDEDLAHLPATQRALAKALRDSLPPNTPRVVGVTLKSYADHLLRHGVQPIVGLLDQFASAIEKEFSATAANEDWGAGLSDLFESFFGNHARLREHFPLANEEVFAETPIDEAKAHGDNLEKPMRDVAAATSEAVNAKIATPNLGNIVVGSAEFARDLSQMVSSRDEENPRSRRITVKRRYVLGTIGFLVTIYNLIGTTASIYSTPQGLALYETLRKAIEAYMAFLL